MEKNTWMSALSGVAVVLVFATRTVAAGGYQTTFTPDHKSGWKIECMCEEAAGSQLGCASKVVEAAGNDQRTWQQDVYATKANEEINLSAACFRKRDAGKGADERHCCFGSESEASKYFVAKVLNEIGTPSGDPNP